jgi:hypothetical protein
MTETNRAPIVRGLEPYTSQPLQVAHFFALSGPQTSTEIFPFDGFSISLARKIAE